MTHPITHLPEFTLPDKITNFHYSNDTLYPVIGFLPGPLPAKVWRGKLVKHDEKVPVAHALYFMKTQGHNASLAVGDFGVANSSDLSNNIDGWSKKGKLARHPRTIISSFSMFSTAAFSDLVANHAAEIAAADILWWFRASGPPAGLSSGDLGVWIPGYFSGTIDTTSSAQAGPFDPFLPVTVQQPKRNPLTGFIGGQTLILNKIFTQGPGYSFYINSQGSGGGLTQPLYLATQTNYLNADVAVINGVDPLFEKIARHVWVDFSTFNFGGGFTGNDNVSIQGQFTSDFTLAVGQVQNTTWHHATEPATGDELWQIVKAFFGL